MTVWSNEDKQVFILAQAFMHTSPYIERESEMERNCVLWSPFGEPAREVKDCDWLIVNAAIQGSPCARRERE